MSTRQRKRARRDRLDYESWMSDLRKQLVAEINKRGGHAQDDLPKWAKAAAVLIALNEVANRNVLGTVAAELGCSAEQIVAWLRRFYPTEKRPPPEGYTLVVHGETDIRVQHLTRTDAIAILQALEVPRVLPRRMVDGFAVRLVDGCHSAKVLGGGVKAP